MKSLHLASLTLLGGLVTITQSVFGDGKVTYDPDTEMVHIPRVQVGNDQYEAKMKYEAAQARFVLTEAKLISTLTFKDREQPDFTKTLTLTEIIAQLPQTDIEVFDPVENRNKTFRGVSTNQLLDQVYGEKWRQQEEMLTTALDGYQSAFPIAKLLNYDSYVVYEQVDRPQFILIKAADGKLVELGPFWLVWDNITAPELKASVSYAWPWQLSGFELVKFTDIFANSAPPANSSEQVQRGFLSTQEFCMGCHKINGDGGKNAPDLIQAGLVADNTNAKIKELITNINVAPVSGMVLRDELTNRDQIADDIIAYLKAMATEK
jgi:hypothetical protein